MRQTKTTSEETFKLVWSFFKDTKEGIEEKTVQGVAKPPPVTVITSNTPT